MSHSITIVILIFFCFSINALQINTNAITVSGLSAGAYMAVQFHVAYSSQVNGSGVIAGGPFYCAQNSMTTAVSACMSAPMLLDVNKLITLTSQFVQENKIDNTVNLKNDKVFLFSGKQDYVVFPDVMKKLLTYYQNYVNPANIKTEFTLTAAHTFPTLDFGTACTTSATPYIAKCNYDAAGTVLNWLYSNLRPKTTAIASNIKSIKQSDYMPSGTTGLADTAYYYLPSACANSKTACDLHVAFHGCMQDPANIQDKYYTKTGYNEWAEANNIIILYPQSKAIPQKNPNACFDWWGYGSSDYAFKTSPQMVTVWNMIKALAASA